MWSVREEGELDAFLEFICLVFRLLVLNTLVHITFQWPGARGAECVSLSLCLSLAFLGTESQRWRSSHVPASPFAPSAGMRKAWDGELMGRDLFPPLQLPG